MGDEKSTEHEHILTSRTDSFFDKLLHYSTGKIATFVAFLFFLIVLVAVYAVIVTKAPLNFVTTVLVLAPAIVGLIAYNNRDLAVIIFVLFLITFFFIFP